MQAMKIPVTISAMIVFLNDAPTSSISRSAMRRVKPVFSSASPKTRAARHSQGRNEPQGAKITFGLATPPSTKRKVMAAAEGVVGRISRAQTVTAHVVMAKNSGSLGCTDGSTSAYTMSGSRILAIHLILRVVIRLVILFP